MSKEETNAYYEKRTEAILEMQKAMARNEQNLREKKNIEKFEAEVLRKVKQDRERERAAEENGGILIASRMARLFGCWNTWTDMLQKS